MKVSLRWLKPDSSGLGDPSIIEAATGVVMSATARFWETATELRSDDPAHFSFDDGLKEQLVEALAGDEDEESRANLIQAMDILCNTYESAVTNLFEKVMSSENVVVFGLSVQERAERRCQIINFGSVALATLIGTSLANLLTGRKR